MPFAGLGLNSSPFGTFNAGPTADPRLHAIFPGMLGTPGQSPAAFGQPYGQTPQGATNANIEFAQALAAAMSDKSAQAQTKAKAAQDEFARNPAGFFQETTLRAAGALSSLGPGQAPARVLRQYFRERVPMENDERRAHLEMLLQIIGALEHSNVAKAVGLLAIHFQFLEAMAKNDETPLSAWSATLPAAIPFPPRSDYFAKVDTDLRLGVGMAGLQNHEQWLSATRHFEQLHKAKEERAKMAATMKRKANQ